MASLIRTLQISQSLVLSSIFFNQLETLHWRGSEMREKKKKGEEEEKKKDQWYYCQSIHLSSMSISNRLRFKAMNAKNLFLHSRSRFTLKFYCLNHENFWVENRRIQSWSIDNGPNLNLVPEGWWAQRWSAIWSLQKSFAMQIWLNLHYDYTS